MSSVGVYAWVAIGGFVPAPWSLLIMGAFLWGYVRYFSGSWGPAATAMARKERFRLGQTPRPRWAWSLLAAATVVAIWHSSLVVTFRVVEFPEEQLTAGYDLTGLPAWLAWGMVIMSSLVAAICEETGYRGYVQVPLERRYRPVPAIALVTTLFVLVHFGQIWAGSMLIQLFMVGSLLGILAYASGSLIPGILAHFGLDVINFSYWWTDLAGRFERRPAAETGIDGHLLLWAVLLVLSVALYAWAIRRMRRAQSSLGA